MVNALVAYLDYVIDWATEYDYGFGWVVLGLLIPIPMAVFVILATFSLAFGYVILIPIAYFIFLGCLVTRKVSRGFIKTYARAGSHGAGVIDDPTITDIAAKYGGVLTKTIASHETRANLDNVQRALERFVTHGEAKRIRVADMIIYDIPSARAHLSPTEKSIIESIIRHKGKISKAELLQEVGVSIEALEASLERLEVAGVMIRTSDQLIRLAVLS